MDIDIVLENGYYDWKCVVNDVLPNICKGKACILIVDFLNNANLIKHDVSIINII